MNLPFDVKAAENQLIAVDDQLAAVISAHGPCTMKVRSVEDPFQALLRSIVYQQLSTASANAIYGRLLSVFEETLPTPDMLLGVEDNVLRATGMSRPKIAYARDLAAKAKEGVVETGKAYVYHQGES